MEQSQKEREKALLMSKIRTGFKNRIGQKALAQSTGFSERKVRRIIHELRVSDVIICSSCAHGGGYWYPETEDEIIDFYEGMDRRAQSHFAAASRARKQTKGNIPGQTDFESVGK